MVVERRREKIEEDFCDRDFCLEARSHVLLDVRARGKTFGEVLRIF
jgi:hypothetical protein